MVRFILFACSAVLALSGSTIAVGGILNEEIKPLAVGLVLLLTAAVLATLYLGTRPNSNSNARPPS